MEKRVHIGGVPVDPLTFDEAIDRADEMLKEERVHKICTPNPEMSVLAFHDAEFRRILNECELAIADGYGLRLIGRLLGHRVPETITGIDFMLALLALCEKREQSVYLLGGDDGVAVAASEKIRELYPKLEIAGARSGGKITKKKGVWKQDEALVEQIRWARPDVLFVALGHGKQEKWIHDHAQDIPSVKIAMGVGGALDFISGKIKRAPEKVRKNGFEWLWRFLKQPWRAPRIIAAVLFFPLIAIYLLIRRK